MRLGLSPLLGGKQIVVAALFPELSLRLMSGPLLYIEREKKELRIAVIEL